MVCRRKSFSFDVNAQVLKAPRLGFAQQRPDCSRHTSCAVDAERSTARRGVQIILGSGPEVDFLMQKSIILQRPIRWRSLNSR
jgi:hypothetical protein